MKKQILKSAFSEYTTKALVGQGGNGKVYSATDDFGAEFAIKILNKELANTSKGKRFKNEYSFCSKMQHENVIKYLDCGIDEMGNPFVVMPLYKSSLRDKMAKLNIPEISVIISNILDGVECAHLSGAIHRDIKPENILINDSGNAIVADFGIAHFNEEIIETFINTHANDRLANFVYAAPEQKIKGGEITKSTDIYSIGLIINELFTGNVPSGSNFKKIVSVSIEFEYFDKIVEKMISQSSNDRYVSIDDIKKDIIFHGKISLERQKLISLESKVIKISDIDDLLITNPPKIVEVDMQNGKLIVTMSQVLNENWKWSFVNLGELQFAQGYQPRQFQINGKKISISVPEYSVDKVFSLFKKWIPQVNKKYESKVRSDIIQKNTQEQEIHNKTISENKKRLEIVERLNRNLL